jgi:hypothetical protein
MSNTSLGSYYASAILLVILSNSKTAFAVAYWQPFPVAK